VERNDNPRKCFRAIALRSSKTFQVPRRIDVK
jgi:hypothetical protein